VQRLSQPQHRRQHRLQHQLVRQLVAHQQQVLPQLQHRQVQQQVRQLIFCLFVRIQRSLAQQDSCHLIKKPTSVRIL
jgi:parvulin-like peptidyl-prolyl isomerase